MADLTLCVSKKCPILLECGRHIGNRTDVNEYRQAICDFFKNNPNDLQEPFYCEHFFYNTSSAPKYNMLVRGVVGNITRLYLRYVLAGQFTLDKVMYGARVAQFNYTPANAKVRVGIDKMMYELIKRGKFRYFISWSIFGRLGYNAKIIEENATRFRQNYLEQETKQDLSFLDLEL